MEVLDDIAAAMMSRQTTNVTVTSELPPEIPYPRFDTSPLSARRYVTSPVEMTCSSSVSTSSSFTYRPTPPQDYLQTPSLEMQQGLSSSTMGSKASFDAFGRGNLTPREYHQRLSMSRKRTMSRRQRKERQAPAMGQGQSMTSTSTMEDTDTEYYGNGRSRESETKARELMVERRRRSQEFEESLV
jgi:hypothetical protein